MRTRLLILVALVTLASSSAFAASYQRTDGTIVDPIQCWDFGCVGNHPYSGNNLEPGADLDGANMSNADLINANMSNANLTSAFMTFANLTSAFLINANLTSAFLTNANLTNANLTNANLTNAELFNVVGLSTSTGAAFYSPSTGFGGTGFDPVAAGWTLVPEPSTALLMGLGLAGLASRRR